MSCYRGSPLWAVGLLFLWSDPGGAQTPIRTDLHGDPLPEHALLRFGSVRLRHQAPTYGVAFSPDGKSMASASTDASFCVWDAATGKQIHRFLVPSVRHRALAFSPDGKMLAAAGWNEAVRLWDLVSGKELAALQLKEGAEESVPAVAFSPDGRTLAAGTYRYSSATAEVRLWEVATNQLRSRLPGHVGMIHGLAFSPGGKLVISGSSDTTALVWDVTGQVGRAVEKLSRARLQALWLELASADAAKAYGALWALALAPRDSVAFFQERLRPIAPQAVPALVTALGANKFAVREQAIRELETLGQEVVPALRQVLDGQITLEVRRRVEQVLATLQQLRPREALRRLRMVEVLEYAGTAQARSLLEVLAQQPGEERLAQEARAALQRLARRAAQ